MPTSSIFCCSVLPASVAGVFCSIASWEDRPGVFVESNPCAISHLYIRQMAPRILKLPKLTSSTQSTSPLVFRVSKATRRAHLSSSKHGQLAAEQQHAATQQTEPR